MKLTEAEYALTNLLLREICDTRGQALRIARLILSDTGPVAKHTGAFLPLVDMPKLHGEVWHPIKPNWPWQPKQYRGSTYEIETAEGLLHICKWAAERGYEARFRSALAAARQEGGER